MRKNYWAVKHDLSRTRIYRIWCGIRARCYNPRSVPYPNYGAKGITVCSEWRNLENGFMNFYKWSMDNGYSDQLSIDRIDPLGNYEPGNCRWATKRIQNINKVRKPNASGYIGICKHQNCNTWYGRVKVNEKTYYTGSAKTPLEAAVMRDKYIEDHGLENLKNGVYHASD